jgi:hypothetical protein
MFPLHVVVTFLLQLVAVDWIILQFVLNDHRVFFQILFLRTLVKRPVVCAEKKASLTYFPCGQNRDKIA